MRGTRIRILAVVIIALALGAPDARSDESERDASAGEETNDVALVVDGQLRKVWTVSELMKGRFDWESPKQHVHPVVPLIFVLDAEGSRVPRAAITGVRLVSRRGALGLVGADLDLLDDVLFKMDVGRSGMWSIVGRDEASERRIEALGGDDRLRKLHRIEVTTESSGSG